jgi:acyl-CoA thioesterase-1
MANPPSLSRLTTVLASAALMAVSLVSVVRAEGPVVGAAARGIVAPAAALPTPAALTAPGAKRAALAEAKAHPCSAPAELARLDQPLARTGRKLAAGAPIKIIAVGSSSTAGAGASTPSASYPSRLAIELTERFPRQPITVLNRGVNGEEASDMLARFDSAVIAENPDLVLWQVGTNSVLRDTPLTPTVSLINGGVRQLKNSGADVVLIDPQFAPKVIVKADAERMVNMIEREAKQANVDLFRRFAVMRHWRESQGMPFDAFISSDELHMNDWSYACLAKVLAGAIAEAATRPTSVAGAVPEISAQQRR